MTDLRYLIPRLIRHFLPERAARFLLRRQWFIRPGIETRAPLEAVKRYRQDLSEQGFSFAGRRVMVFGYGGRFAVGCHLLKEGAAHVVLAEKDGFVEDGRNRALLPEFADYLELNNGRVRPRPQHITLLHGDIRQIAAGKSLAPVEVVLSSSVYEHLDDVPGITRALAQLTAPGGIHLHYIDLRDHFFKYPFEMLTFDERTWRNWLNPTSNHNRYRQWDYQRVFTAVFAQARCDVLERNLAAFEAARRRIRPEFLSGDPQVDAVTLMRVLAREPRKE